MNLAEIERRKAENSQGDKDNKSQRDNKLSSARRCRFTITLTITIRKR